MPIYKMSVKFSVVHEKRIPDVEADNEFEALTEAWESADGIIRELIDQYGESVVLEEIIANPVGEPENKTTM